MTGLVVRAQIAGKRNFSPAPLEYERDAGIVTVRDLLESIVRSQVDGFIRRKQEAAILRVLTERDIQHGRAAGRIVSGEQEPDDRVPDVHHAIEAAVTAFEDGFYFVFVNDRQVEKLDQVLDPDEPLDVLFVRLTPLAGG